SQTILKSNGNPSLLVWEKPGSSYYEWLLKTHRNSSIPGASPIGIISNQRHPPYNSIFYDFSTALRYAIHFNDGVSIECSSSAGALRVIAYRHRVAPADLVTDRTEERILV